jgi:hypothetical protein
LREDVEMTLVGRIGGDQPTWLIEAFPEPLSNDLDATVDNLPWQVDRSHIIASHKQVR